MNLSGFTILLFTLPFSFHLFAQADSTFTKPSPKAFGLVRGFVRDQANGETMPYVNVVLEGTQLGDATDENGYYLIGRIPPGEYLLKAMMIGYQPQEMQVKVLAGKTVTLNFSLAPSAIELEEITKTAERERFERQIESSTIQLSPREITSAPAVIEADLFRTLQMLPGVVARTDFSSALYIRGGNPSENLILLDDVRIYNPYHLGGVFSTFNTDAIKNVDVSVGGFPARYGNAASSVISITNKDGNSKEFAAKGSVSLLSSRLLLESPIPRGSILLSGRRTYFDFIYNRFFRSDPSSAGRFPYYFYDFHGKINLALSEKSKLTLSGFYGDDIVHVEEDREAFNPETLTWENAGKEVTDIRFGNRTTTLKWQQLFSPRLFSEFILAGSQFRSRISTTTEDDVSANDEIKDLTLKSEWTYFLSDRHEMKFGAEFQRLDFTLFFKVEDFTWLAYRGEKSRNADFSSIFLQDNWEVNPLLNLQAGLRVTQYDLGNYVRYDPRLSLRYRLRHNLNFKGSFGIYHQYFYTFNPEDFDYIRLVDLWFPIDERYQPIRANHYIAGLEHWLGDDYTISLEGYYKDYDHVLDLNELGQEDVELDDFLQGWGNAGGVEALFRKQRGKLTGWLGYSLAWTERTIESPRPSSQLPNSHEPIKYQSFPPGHDRRHSLTLVAAYQPGGKWEFSTRFTYGSGLPETPTIGWRNCYEIEGGDPSVSQCAVKAPKNSERLPSYLRLDVSLARTYSFNGWSLNPYLQIINVTNHHNIFLYDYENYAPVFDSQGNYVGTRPERQGIIMFPILPTIGVNFEF